MKMERLAQNMAAYNAGRQQVSNLRQQQATNRIQQQQVDFARSQQRQIDFNHTVFRGGSIKVHPALPCSIIAGALLIPGIIFLPLGLTNGGSLAFTVTGSVSLALSMIASICAVLIWACGKKDNSSAPTPETPATTEVNSYCSKETSDLICKIATNVIMFSFLAAGAAMIGVGVPQLNSSSQQAVGLVAAGAVLLFLGSIYCVPKTLLYLSSFVSSDPKDVACKILTWGLMLGFFGGAGAMLGIGIPQVNPSNSTAAGFILVSMGAVLLCVASTCFCCLSKQLCCPSPNNNANRASPV